MFCFILIICLFEEKKHKELLFIYLLIIVIISEFCLTLLFSFFYLYISFFSKQPRSTVTAYKGISPHDFFPVVL